MTLRRARLLLALAVAPLLAASPTSSQETRDRLVVDASAVGRADLAARLRAVHRAPGPLHLRRPLGRDARGPQVLLPVTGEAPALEMFTPGPRSWDGEGIPTSCSSARPWLVLGDRAGVSMLREGAYAGEQSAKLALPGGEKSLGLMQERLGLVAGREYVGRIVLRAKGRPGPSR